jgi:hypothetical protein
MKCTCKEQYLPKGSCFACVYVAVNLSIKRGSWIPR